MGWLDWLLLGGTSDGGTSESDSLETRMEYEVNREVEDRKRQARDRRITEKAIKVLLGCGECDNNAYMVSYKYGSHSCPCGEMIISGSISKITEDIYWPHNSDDSCSSDLKGRIDKIHFGIVIDLKGSTVYRDYGESEKSYSCFFSSIFPSLGRIFDYSKTIELSDILKYNHLDCIKIYKPGEWEAHLDKLYHRIPLVRVEKAEILTRKAEEKARKELEEKQQKVQAELENKRKELEDKKKCFGL